MSEEASLPGLTPTEVETLKKVFSSPLDIPQEWKAWIVSYLEANPPSIPLSQILGYKVNAFASPRVWTSGTWPTTNNAAYGDASDGLGPEIKDMPDGTYVILFGCMASGSSGSNANYVSLSVNGATAVDADAVQSWQGPQPEVIFTAIFKTLTNDNKNTLKMKYKRLETGSNMTVNGRWIIAIRIA